MVKKKPKTKTRKSLIKAIKTATEKRKAELKAGPVWKGPEVDGVTQSMLGSFLVCRERFRLRVIEGLATAPEFSKNIEYAQMWHECEATLTKRDGFWQASLQTYTSKLCKKYPLAQEQILHWFRVCRTQFEVYIKWQAKQPKDRKKVTELLTEQTFKIPYELPSGKIVLLRGKWDGVKLVGVRKNAGIWLKEHKTKGDINEEQIQRQLTFDLQTMTYLVALHKTSEGNSLGCDYPIKGVIYNVVRRPLSGGVGSIRPHKATKTKPEETMDHYYGRLRAIIEEQPEHFFMKWDATVTPQDIEKFKTQFLNPVLEQLCSWYYRLESCQRNNLDFFTARGNTPLKDDVHWRHPFGVWNSLNEGRASDVDSYLATGSEVGLVRGRPLFEELK